MFKKILSFFITAVLLVGGLRILEQRFFADNSDFKIENGILLSYTGREESVIIPASVYYIGDNAFSDNEKIVSVELNENVRYIGDNAFYNATSLVSVTKTDSIVSIGHNTFAKTPFLQNQEELFIINHILVKYKGTNEEVYIPDHINSVAAGAFQGNENIKRVIIHDNVTEIGKSSFEGCLNLQSIDIPKSVLTIGEDAFKNTLWLNRQNDFVVCGNHILVLYKGNSDVPVLPNGLLQIAPGAFENSKIKKIVLPSTVYIIGKKAFQNCIQLSSVTLSKNLVFIDSCAFNGCASIKHISVLNKAEKISQNAFANCVQLQQISLPSSLKSIADNAFDACPYVKIFTKFNSIPWEWSEKNNIETYHQKGDINCDDKINIKDATYIQKCLAKIIHMTDAMKLLGDVDFDGQVTIKDVTLLQKHLANFEV